MDNKEISKITMWAMISVAVFFDTIQLGVVWIYFIPMPIVGFILGWLISVGVSIFAFLTFSLWFYLAGLKYNSKIAASTIGTFLIELVPGLSGFFFWTISVATTLLFFQAKKTVAKIMPGAEKLIDKSAKSYRKVA